MTPELDTATLLVILSLGTLVAVLVLALISKRKTEKRLEDDQAEKSTLARDAPNRR